MAKILWCPSGAGKTHFVLNTTGHRPVDGDVIVGVHGIWPSTPRWWERPDIALRVQREAHDALDWYCAGTPDTTLVLSAIHNPQFVNDEHTFGFVIPEHDTLTRRRLLRARRFDGVQRFFGPGPTEASPHGLGPAITSEKRVASQPAEPVSEREYERILEDYGLYAPHARLFRTIGEAVCAHNLLFRR